MSGGSLTRKERWRTNAGGRRLLRLLYNPFGNRTYQVINSAIVTAKGKADC